LEQQIADLQERLQERDSAISVHTGKVKELEEALANIENSSKKAATEQSSAKSAGDSQVLVLNSKLKVLQASVDEKQYVPNSVLPYFFFFFFFLSSLKFLSRWSLFL